MMSEELQKSTHSSVSSSLCGWHTDFQTDAYKVKTSSSLGKLLLVKVEKDSSFIFPEDEWYCSKILATTPEDDNIVFPCYGWISKEGTCGAQRRKRTELKCNKYVSEHWKEDFFGFQFLNGTNPNVIKHCSILPPNFPVTEILKHFLETGTTLKKKMEEGNIFCDQRIIDGIPTRQKDGNPLFATVGLCLFYMNPEGKLMPTAIQLYQQPSEQNPIFLPSDLETDWLLAKLFFRSSDLIQHQTVYHLMHTHYLAEVFAVATLYCFPTIHPLYKLLIPHFRYTLHVNILVRNILLSPGGALSESSLGVEGLMALMRRDLSQMTYGSLCLPENIAGRGLESIPNFYFRDNALKLWNYLNRQLNYAKDYNSWMPNGSILLCKPPPTTKGQSSIQTVLEALPNVEDTVKIVSTVFLNEFPEKNFDEPVPKEIIKGLEGDLSYPREEIAARNSQLEIPYPYLNPAVIKNSVII
ncbi:LOW QUALITY PROTEIN: arachidonate 12-lipoxygenase, 12R-type-like [Anableps anableps]